jgi:hypothetical protein
MPNWQSPTSPDDAPALRPRYVVCHGEIVFSTPHFVGFVPPGRSAGPPLAVPRSVIDPDFPQPGPNPSLSDYGLALDQAWVRQHLCFQRSSGTPRGSGPLTALGALAAVALIWWALV